MGRKIITFGFIFLVFAVVVGLLLYALYTSYVFAASAWV